MTAPKPRSLLKKCKATSSRTGRRCGNWAMAGQDVCGTHGGRAPQNKAAGARRAAEEQVRQKAERYLAKRTVKPVTDALTGLTEVAGEIVAVKDWLREHVQALEEIRYRGGQGEQLRAELSAYQAALRDTVSVLGLIAKLDIDTRLARITERQADAVIRAIDAALATAGVTGAAAADAKKVAARHLRAV